MAQSNTPEHPAATAHDPVAQTIALIQPWIEYVPRRQRRLGVFIFIALLMHLALFFFIRIDSTRAELRHQARTHVAVDFPRAVAVNGENGDDLIDRLNDPRLFLLPLKPMASLASDDPPITPDDIASAAPLPSPAPPVDYHATLPAATPLEQKVEEAMRPPRQPFSYNETPPAVSNKTTWQWDDALNSRQPVGVPDLPSPVSDTDLSPTVLRVAVGANGMVENALVEHRPSDLDAAATTDLDQQAMLAARKIRFKPSDQPGVMWGRLTVFWKYAAKPREEVVPTPPTTQ